MRRLTLTPQEFKDFCKNKKISIPYSPDSDNSYYIEVRKSDFFKELANAISFVFTFVDYSAKRVFIEEVHF